MIKKFAIFLSFIFPVVAMAAEELKASDYKATLVSVGVAPENFTSLDEVKFSSPSERVVVPPGCLAVFKIDYAFTGPRKSYLFLGTNFKTGDGAALEEDPFGTSASGLYHGKGTTTKIVILMPEQYEKPLLLKSVKITGEMEAKEDEDRNESFFIGKADVNVLYAKENVKSDSEAVVLEPLPAPKFDSSFGVRKKTQKGKTSTPEGFTDNLGDALAKAKSEGKLVYACFSGSDWCGWCIKLEREVLSKSEFVDGVKNDFVLVFIDSPRNKSLLSEYAKKANKGLAKKYGIRGYPTALILDGDGNTIGKTGYRKGGAKGYVKHLMKYRTPDPKK